MELCRKLIRDNRASKDVLANVFYDILTCDESISSGGDNEPTREGWSEEEYERRFGNEQLPDSRAGIRFGDVKNALAGIPQVESANDVFPFLETRKSDLATLIGKRSRLFSEEILSEIFEVLQIDRQ